MENNEVKFLCEQQKMKTKKLVVNKELTIIKIEIDGKRIQHLENNFLGITLSSNENKKTEVKIELQYAYKEAAC